MPHPSHREVDSLWDPVLSRDEEDSGVQSDDLCLVFVFVFIQKRGFPNRGPLPLTSLFLYAPPAPVCGCVGREVSN